MIRRLALQFAGFLLSIFPFALIFVRVLKHGWRQVFHVEPHDQIPSCLLDPKLGKHGYIRTKDGVRIHYVEKGDCEHPLMVFLHGFPDFWYTWRHQMEIHGHQNKIWRTPLLSFENLTFNRKHLQQQAGLQICSHHNDTTLSMGWRS